MPKRRLQTIPEAPQRPPRTKKFKVAVGHPQCGRREANHWIDTGVFLSMGSDPDLPEIFEDHFDRGVFVAEAVTRELRNIARRSGPDLDNPAQVALDGIYARGLIQTVELTEADLALRATVLRQLQGLADTQDGKHGGEAETIALAARRATELGDPESQVLYSNDGDASQVADRYNIATRHAGDVLAEFACASRLTPERCWEVFSDSNRVSAVPSNARQRNVEEFQCSASESQCDKCSNQN